MHVDGRIDASEIQNIVTTLVAEKNKSKAFKIGLVILCLFTTVLLGAIFGLTWAVVAAFKDTQVGPVSRSFVRPTLHNALPSLDSVPRR